MAKDENAAKRRKTDRPSEKGKARNKEITPEKNKEAVDEKKGAIIRKNAESTSSPVAETKKKVSDKKKVKKASESTEMTKDENAAKRLEIGTPSGKGKARREEMAPEKNKEAVDEKKGVVIEKNAESTFSPVAETKKKVSDKKKEKKASESTEMTKNENAAKRLEIGTPSGKGKARREEMAAEKNKEAVDEKKGVVIEKNAESTASRFDEWKKKLSPEEFKWFEKNVTMRDPVSPCRHPNMACVVYNIFNRAYKCNTCGYFEHVVEDNDK